MKYCAPFLALGLLLVACAEPEDSTESASGAVSVTAGVAAVDDDAEIGRAVYVTASQSPLLLTARTPVAVHLTPLTTGIVQSDSISRGGVTCQLRDGKAASFVDYIPRGMSFVVMGTIPSSKGIDIILFTETSAADGHVGVIFLHCDKQRGTWNDVQRALLDTFDVEANPRFRH